MSSGYLQDILSHFARFVQDRGARPEDVHVRFFLADGSSYVIRGPKVVSPGAPGGFGLIEDAAQRLNAVLVREQHVVKVEFAGGPVESTTPIGLHTEAGDTREHAKDQQ